MVVDCTSDFSGSAAAKLVQLERVFNLLKVSLTGQVGACIAKIAGAVPAVVSSLSCRDS